MPTHRKTVLDRAIVFWVYTSLYVILAGGTLLQIRQLILYLLEFKAAIQKSESKLHTCSLQDWSHCWYDLITCTPCTHELLQTHNQVILSAKLICIIFSYRSTLHFKPLLADFNDVSKILCIPKVKLLSTLSHCWTYPYHFVTGAVAHDFGKSQLSFENNLLCCRSLPVWVAFRLCYLNYHHKILRTEYLEDIFYFFSANGKIEADGERSVY